MFRGTLAVLLATAFAPWPAAAATSLPGTALALGMTISRVDSMIAFEPDGPQAAPARRRGVTRFFGLNAQADLDFDSGVLVHARFSVPGTSTHSRDYIEDQLRRLGLAPGCARLDAAIHDCVWTGTARLHVVWNTGALTADAGLAIAPGAPGASRESETMAALATLTQRTLAAGHAGGAAPKSTGATAPANAAGTSAAGAGVAGAEVARASATGGIVAAAGGSIAPADSAGTRPPAAQASAGPSAVFLADTLLVGAKRTSRSQFIPQLAAPMQAPSYPPAAARAGVQGVVRVLATVDSMGTVTRTVVLRSIPELDAAALAASQRCRFVPLWSGGHRVGYRVVIPVTFTR